MNFFYQLGIFFYLLAARILAPFNIKARQFARGQKASFPYLESKINHNRPIIWVHCASLGEFEQGRPLIEHIKKTQPDYQVLLSFFSPSGYEIRKNYDQADYICYQPIDTLKNAKRFIELVRPEKVFFIKYEFWFNYMNLLNRKQIPLYLVSAIFRKEQLFFKSGIKAKWYRNILSKVTHFFVQTPESARLLAEIGLKNSTVTGDTRFDRVAEIAANYKELPLVETFKDGQQLIVAGSSWAPDEEKLISFLKQNPKTKLIFAPHEVKASNIKRLKEQLPTPAVCYSEAHDKDLASAQVLIVDTIGILSSIYRYADIAYIGGGFGVGIHNTLEAAIYNIPVIFGPNYQRFQEAVNLKERGIAFSIATSEELNTILTQLLTDSSRRESISKKCREFMAENLGATQQVTQKVFNKK